VEDQFILKLVDYKEHPDVHQSVSIVAGASSRKERKFDQHLLEHIEHNVKHAIALI
jgi:hypothetical protein